MGAVSSARIRRPGRGRRGSGTFSTSHECPPGETPTLHPRPFRPLFFLLCCPVGRGTASHGIRPTSPRSRTRLLCFPRPFFSSWGDCRPGLPLFSLPDAPFSCPQLDAFSISLNVPSPVVRRTRPPDLACSWA